MVLESRRKTRISKESKERRPKRNPRKDNKLTNYMEGMKG